MLEKTITFSIKNRLLVVIAAAMLLALGLYVASDMDIDVFPDLTAPTVVVMTDAHSMAPEEVERLVTFPIETAVNGATNVRRVRSASAAGFSLVWVEFEWGTDIFKARQIVSEKLISLAERMPSEAGVPTLAPQSSIMGEILIVGLTADSTSLMDLRTMAEWNIRPALLATGGVSQVTIIGGEYKQYQVLADPHMMNYYGITMMQLLETCKGLNKNSSGGRLNEYGNEYLIRGIGRTSDLEELGSSLIPLDSGKRVQLRDVANIKIGAAIKNRGSFRQQ